MTEPKDLLKQDALREDYLAPFEGLINEVSREKDYILNQILRWSIINYVPLKQFFPGRLHICSYENIYQEPSQEVA